MKLINMKLMKNPEVKRELAVYAILIVSFAIAGAFESAVCGLLLLVLGVMLTAVYIFSLFKRYDAISELSFTINHILHGQEKILFTDSNEGELAVLRSEIGKMTIRLREQADELKKDKLTLVDATADISHQLRTPLTSINLIISLLSEENITDQKRIQLTHELKKLLRRIDWLIEALLKISRIDAGAVNFKSENVSVRELINKASAPLLIPMELREQEFRINAAEESFKGDILWSVEALGNILKNCMENTPAGGMIEVTANETALFTEITVCDNGKGFDSEDIPHLFERFYKGKNAGTNSVGIGLALARMVISAQNGTISAASGKNGGAVFTIKCYKSRF